MINTCQFLTVKKTLWVQDLLHWQAIGEETTKATQGNRVSNLILTLPRKPHHRSTITKMISYRTRELITINSLFAISFPVFKYRDINADIQPIIFYKKLYIYPPPLPHIHHLMSNHIYTSRYTTHNEFPSNEFNYRLSFTLRWTASNPLRVPSSLFDEAHKSLGNVINAKQTWG